MVEEVSKAARPVEAEMQSKPRNQVDSLEMRHIFVGVGV